MGSKRYLIFHLAFFILTSMHNAITKISARKKYSLIYSMPALSFIGAIASLSHNNYTFVVITALLIFLIVEKKITQKVAITIAILCVSLACTGFNALISHMDNMETGSKAEMLSFLLQATARTLVKYPDDITPEEEILSILFGQERFSNMKNYYNTQISDLVKYEINTDQELLTSYFAIWIEQGIRHPITYLESFFLCDAGYLSLLIIHPKKELLLCKQEYNLPKNMMKRFPRPLNLLGNHYVKALAN